MEEQLINFGAFLKDYKAGRLGELRGQYVAYYRGFLLTFSPSSEEIKQDALELLVREVKILKINNQLQGDVVNLEVLISKVPET